MLSPTVRNRWLEHLRLPSPGILRLFCFPYAGAGASIYRSWPARLPSFVETVPVHLPGRENRHSEPAAVDLNALADRIAEELYPTFREAPFAIFGHSMGATLGFEVARTLSKRFGLFPKALFISGRPAPQIVRPNAPTYNLPETEFLAELRRMNGTPREVIDSAELMTVLTPILRADFEAIQTYHSRSSARLPCPIVAFGGSEDKEIPRESLEAWQPHTISSFQLTMLAGDHFFIHSQRDALLELLSHELMKYRPNLSDRRSGSTQCKPYHQSVNHAGTATSASKRENP